MTAKIFTLEMTGEEADALVALTGAGIALKRNKPEMAISLIHEYATAIPQQVRVTIVAKLMELSLDRAAQLEISE